jgi:hypothetical protein
MLPVYVVYAFICYLSLALLIPLGWALIPVWRKARLARHVTCPAVGHSAVVSLDAWYAVKMHTLGNEEKRVRGCSEWPKCSHCRQECLVQLGNAA